MRIAGDFDYALQKDPDTERDSSASAIALDGMLRLLQVLPSHDSDRDRYLKDAQNILYPLTTSDYLPDTDSPEQSILVMVVTIIHKRSIQARESMIMG